MERSGVPRTTRQLFCHPASPSSAIREIRVGLDCLDTTVVGCVFELAGEIARLRVPAPAEPEFADGLWQHTCCEMFLAPDREGEVRYLELNFSPSGRWAGYAFAAYRERVATLAGGAAPAVTVGRHPDRLRVEARVPLRLAAPWAGDPPWRVGLSMVVEEKSGVLSYWALQHAGAKPDFHRPGAFAERLYVSPAIAGAPGDADRASRGGSAQGGS